ncbi:MAG: hypothetical protein MR820_01880 [Prevotella sp.]|uniref:hypothetical protein n=1 Tax=Leyella stercorea TaxID=363265 RepID=UPI001F320613|nr:hypothetical protein [Leyella stercorea]MCF2615356.1 hypothetical protein [Leyella stercorea]MCI6402818.1 hypothetical protein [Prevotella sp.]
MATKKIKKVLLIEPNYSNKYPPIGLMKLSTYYKNLGGWEVTFFKGDLKMFVIERIADRCIEEFNYIDSTIDWFLKRDEFIEYIKTRKKEVIERLAIERSDMELILLAKLDDWKNYYWKGTWKDNPEWDRVGVTTLFTFYWDITVETINFAKLLVKKKKDLMVGGVLASIQPKELEEATGIKPWVGILGKPGVLDKGDTQIIDNLPLDYSILDEIEYKYPMSNAFYGYMTRGCIRHCAFCAVPTLEDKYIPYIPLKDRLDAVREVYGDQKDLLLMDNNVLASENLKDIIDDIVASGFGKGAKFVQPDMLEISIRNLQNGVNDRAYIRKSQALIAEFYQKLKPMKGDESYEVYKVMARYHINKLATTKKENLIAAYEEIKDIYKRHQHPVPRARYVDFNQGVDARLFTEEIVELLSRIAIRPLRIAFDDIKTFPSYNKAIRMSAAAGLKDFSNYLLYNFVDKPLDLYQRLRINVELCDELNVNIYSFPMKYHPIRKGKDDAEDLSHNRDYIGKHWNRKYIRAIQAILNSTKGKVGKGITFFLEAFGNDETEYMELLEMPETFILYRFFFKWLDEKGSMGTDHWRQCWSHCMNTLAEDEKQLVLDIIHTNTFYKEELEAVTSADALKLLNFYTNYRKDIITPGTELYRLKQEYDENPTIQLRRKK